MIVLCLQSLEALCVVVVVVVVVAETSSFQSESNGTFPLTFQTPVVMRHSDDQNSQNALLSGHDDDGSSEQKLPQLHQQEEGVLRAQDTRVIRPRHYYSFKLRGIDYYVSPFFTFLFLNLYLFYYCICFIILLLFYIFYSYLVIILIFLFI